MRFFYSSLLVASVTLAISCSRNHTMELFSPDKNISMALTMSENGTPHYAISYKEQKVILPSPMGLVLNGEVILSDNLSLQKTDTSSFEETYSVIGKSAQAHSHYNQLRIELADDEERQLILEFRAFNEGIAFRYIVPRQEGITDYSLIEEKTGFRFPEENMMIWRTDLKTLENRDIYHYEAEYHKGTWKDVDDSSLLSLPVTFVAPEHYAGAITEAAVTDFPHMYLERNAEGFLKPRLSPRKERGSIVATSESHISTPWRVIMLADKAVDLISSNLITHLNAPSKIEDTSWIKPGKVAWDWWNNYNVEGVAVQGMNNETMQKYIDFAGENDLQYMLIDAAWYGPHTDTTADITTSIPEIDIPMLVEYARQRDVGIHLWLNYANLKNQMNEAFSTYEKWGIKGVKIDYMNNDDQEMVRFYHQVVEAAATHKLMVNWHGAYKPTGIRRTYPNLITREGVLGLEYLKWSDRANPDHNVTIPFTRMLVGPMDYTPGGFDNVTPEEFRPVNEDPMALGTRAHQLAMYVIYESPLQMLSDHPSSYKNGVGLDFLRRVPASWDETVPIAGEIGEYIILARRKGQTWFIGGMGNSQSRTLEVSLAFLEAGEYTMSLYKDSPNADTRPKEVTTSQSVVDSSKQISIDLAPGGGFVMILEPDGVD